MKNFLTEKSILQKELLTAMEQLKACVIPDAASIKFIYIIDKVME